MQCRSFAILGLGMFVLALALVGCASAASGWIEPDATDAAPSRETMDDAEPSPSVGEDGGYQGGFTEEGEPYRGDLAVEVVIEEFSSYQCPFCAKFFQ